MLHLQQRNNIVLRITLQNHIQRQHLNHFFDKCSFKTGPPGPKGTKGKPGKQGLPELDDRGLRTQKKEGDPLNYKVLLKIIIQR